MRDHLLDLVEHTHDLGVIDLVKITGDDKSTVINGLAEDRSVVVEGHICTTTRRLYWQLWHAKLEQVKDSFELARVSRERTTQFNKERHWCTLTASTL
jgi:hypothetical protein